MASSRGGVGAVLALLVAVAVALFLGRDADVDVRVKLTHVLLRTLFGASRLLGTAPPFDRMNAQPVVPTGPGDDGVTSVDLVVPHAPQSVFPGIFPLVDVGVRVYYPTTTSPPTDAPTPTTEDDTKLPILVYMHGGGYTLGRAGHRFTEGFIRRFAVDGRMLVVSVDYRLAPAVTLPAPVDDCLAAVLWAHAATHPILKQHGDPSRLVLIGDSAGGGLVAVVTQALFKHHPEVKVAHQILLYPVNQPLAGQTTESRKAYANGWILFDDAVRGFADAYMPTNQTLLDSYIVRPRLGRDTFAALPPGQVVLGELDMLRDEGIEYYDALKAAGVDVTLRVYPKMVHGFFGFQYLPEAQLAYQEVMGVLRSKGLARCGLGAHPS